MRIFVIVALALAAPRAAHAQATETIEEGGATITRIDGARITIDHGAKAGIKVGDTGDVFPLRTQGASGPLMVELDVRLAVARVTEVKDDAATLTIDAVAGTIEVGAYLRYRASVSAGVARSPLVRVLAQGITLTSMDNSPIVTFETLRNDPTGTAGNQALDAMVTELKGMRALVVGAFTDPPSSGIYRGKTVGAIIDGLDRAQMLAFIEHLDGYALSYIGQRWKLFDPFFRWVFEGTQSGEQFRRSRVMKPLWTKAKDALHAGKLDDARAILVTILKDWAEATDARDMLARVDRALTLRRAVATDPDDTADGFALMHELHTLGAYDAALAEHGPLKQRAFDGLKLETEHGLVLLGAEKWSAAKDVFDALTKLRPTDTEIAGSAQLARAHAKAANAPADFAALIELATVMLARDDWDHAVATYRKVLDSKSATPKQRAAAADGQEGVAAARQLDVLRQWTLENIDLHLLTVAREHVAAMLPLADKLGERRRLSSIFKQLAKRARNASESELAVELLRKRVALTPDDQGAYTELAFGLLADERLDDAETVANQALTKKGTESESALLVLAHIARMRGNLADAEKYATKAAALRTFALPRTVLARVLAARGEWEDAQTLAGKALELDSDTVDINLTLRASARGLQAAEGLLADPKSARERLRLVRALADLGLTKRVQEEIAKLPKDGAWRSDAWWSLADSTDRQVMLRDRLAAAREARPTTPQRKRMLDRLEAVDKLRGKPNDAATRISLAKIYIVDDNFDLALATLGPLLALDVPPPAADSLATDVRDALSLASQLDAGRNAFGRNDQESAIRIALAVEHGYDQIGAPAGRIAARVLHAEALGQQGKYPEAIKLVEEARAIALADGDTRQVAELERRIAGHRASTGTSDELATALERNRRVCADFDDEWCLFFVERQIASLERDEGHTASAITHARTTWNLADRLGRPDFARAAQLELALTSLEGNRVLDGESLAIKLLADSRAHGDRVYEQAATVLLGAVAMLRGDGPKARARYQEVYDLGTRYGESTWRATARRFEGLAWLEADHQPAKAALAFQQAAELYAQSASGAAVQERGTALRRLADARLQSGDVTGARKAAEEGVALAQQFGKRLQLATAQWLLALVALGEGKPDEAVKRAKDAVAIAEQTDSVTVLWNAYYVLGRAYQLKNQDKDALAAYEQALPYVGSALLASGSDTERSGYMSTGRVREVYRNTIDLLLKLGMTTRAMEVLELSRDAMLKQSFDATQVSTPDAAVQALLDKYNAARAHVNGLQKQLDKAAETRNAAQLKALGAGIAMARTTLSDVALELKVTHRELFQALSMAPQEIAARSSALPAGTVVVEYFVAADTLTMFVISPKLEQPVVVRVKVTATELAQTIDAYRDALLTEKEPIKERDKVESLGRKLEKWLLAPVRAQLKDASTVVVVPFGPLYYVPFDGLVVSDAGKPVRYALEDYRFAVQTTWTLEALLRPARARSTGRMLAIANPDGTLPGAQQEVSRIMKTALPDAQVLGKKEATVKRVQELAGTSRYLHIATHGILDADSRKSYLKMSDGGLTVRDIATLKGLRTNNDLVVLSACDTATELRDSAGDEVVSLASSFALAGSPAVVASLWEISDDSTAELMATFYRALEQNKGDRLDALRTAKLNLLRTEKGKQHPYASPWHWASFQLYGDFRAPAPVSGTAASPAARGQARPDR